jgi:hypothetical protein
MGDRRWLDGYAGQTTDELIALDGEYRQDSIVLAFEAGIDQKAVRVGIERLTSEERVVLAIEALEREVNNDGFDGLFRSAAAQVPDLVAALRAIGCNAVADLARSAIGQLEIDGPLTPAAVEAAIDRDDPERDERLNEFDEAYYETAGDLTEPLLAFIKASRDQIALP